MIFWVEAQLSPTIAAESLDEILRRVLREELARRG